MGSSSDDDFLVPCTGEHYHFIGKIIREEHGDECLKIGATCSLPQGSSFSGPIMMTTWMFEGYPVVRIEQTNSGSKIKHDATDEWRFWINADLIWKLRRRAR